MARTTTNSLHVKLTPHGAWISARMPRKEDTTSPNEPVFAGETVLDLVATLIAVGRKGEMIKCLSNLEFDARP